MNYLYSITNSQVKIEQYCLPMEEETIPQTINHMPVTFIGDYAFKECRQLRKVSLPASVLKVGSHAFYHCTSLKELVLYDTVQEIGDGAFKNCRSLKYIKYYLRQGVFKSMKSILSETNGELLFSIYDARHINGQVSAVSQLVFPRYLYDYEENTEARIINQVTYGSGVHYRECVTGQEIDFRAYDEAFQTAAALESTKTAADIAMNRLLYPYKLEDKYKQVYHHYLSEHLMDMVEPFILNENQSMLKQLEALHLYTPDAVEKILDLARRKNRVSMISYFMDYCQKYQKDSKHRARYEL